MRRTEILPLFARLSNDEQQRIFARPLRTHPLGETWNEHDPERPAAGFFAQLGVGNMIDPTVEEVPLPQPKPSAAASSSS